MWLNLWLQFGEDPHMGVTVRFTHPSGHYSVCGKNILFVRSELMRSVLFPTIFHVHSLAFSKSEAEK